MDPVTRRALKTLIDRRKRELVPWPPRDVDKRADWEAAIERRRDHQAAYNARRRPTPGTK